MPSISSARLASRIGYTKGLVPSTYVLSVILVAEFAEYWLYRLLHGYGTEWPDEGRPVHHPETHLTNGAWCSEDYAGAGHGAFSPSRAEGEWILPAGVAMLFCFGVLRAFSFRRGNRALESGGRIGLGAFAAEEEMDARAGRMLQS
jgi:hypothetical protein